MPTFTTSIRLLSATDADYKRLSQELQKKSFNPAVLSKTGSGKATSSPIVFNSKNQASLLDATTAVSQAAAMTGRKYSFTVMKDKAIREY